MSQVVFKKNVKKTRNVPFTVIENANNFNSFCVILGFIGTPGDMINVRMQNDVKLPIENRRKYVYYLIE